MRSGLLVTSILAGALAARGLAQDPVKLLELRTWGAPWDERFEVTVEAPELLTAVKHLPPTRENPESEKRVEVRLSQAEVDDAMALARAAVEERDPRGVCRLVADGTSARLEVLLDGGERKHRECRNAMVWPPEDSKAKDLLEWINARLPKDLQVY
jgi:hypothetical protein